MGPIINNLFSPDVLGILIQAIGAIIVASITNRVAKKVVSRRDQKQRKLLNNNKQKRFGGWIITGIVAGVTFFLMGLGYDITKGKILQPQVTITNPTSNQQIAVTIVKGEPEVGFYIVKGSSSRVASNSNLRVYVLVHPVEPFGEGWWLQPEGIVNLDGTWETQVWAGSKVTPVEVGYKFDIIAIVATEQSNEQKKKAIKDPKNLKPKAFSDIVRITIGAK